MSGGLRGLVVLAVLLGLSGFFMVVILDRTAPVLPPIGIDTPGAGSAEGFTLPTLEPAGIGTFSAALEHPLFSRSRTPPEVTVDSGPAPAPSEVDAKLAGVTATGTEKVAIVFPTGSTRGQQLREGDWFQGWEVIEINDDSIVLERDGRTETLILDFAGETPAKPDDAPAQKNEPPARRRRVRPGR